MSAGKSVSYVEVESDKGHDAFLLPNDRYEKALAGYLSRVAEGLGASVGDEQ
jgi:homoserine O-acetyltransferase